MSLEFLTGCTSLTIATPVLSALDIQSCEWEIDPELHEIMSANSDFSSIVIGNMKCVITLVTTDYTFFAGLVKGMQVTTVTATYKAGATDISPSTYDRTGNSGSISFIVSNMRVMEAIKLNIGNDKKPAEYTIKLQACRVKGTGADPTITPELSLA